MDVQREKELKRMSIEILDPTHEGASLDFATAARLTALEGMRIGIISNGKFGTKPFFDAIERELIENYGAARVIRRTKANYSAPAEAALLREAEAWDALIAGIGD
jgi:hypothetical protein